MPGIKWVFFDCMETIIDVKKIPDQRLYASWGFYGSNLENFWDGFSAFFEEYMVVTRMLEERYGPYREYGLEERFDLMVSRLSGVDCSQQTKTLSSKLLENYWANYKRNCQVKKELPQILKFIQDNFPMGVVSNFKKPGGIRELLEIHELISFFSFLVTSIGVGWKKPHPKIYEEALKKAGVKPEEVVFIGDNFSCDYSGPKELGMKPILLDRGSRYEKIPSRVISIEELPGIFSELIRKNNQV